MTLQSFIHSTLTTLLSPQKSRTVIETDYEISEYEDSLHSISDRIIWQRQQQSASNTPTPTRSTRSTSTANTTTLPRPTNTIDFPRYLTTATTPTPAQDDREKIREFINVKQMLLSLRNLEKLITDPDINYERFKQTYIESSMGLLESIQDKEVLTGSVRTDSAESRDLVMKIGLVSVQILVVLIDLFTPLLVKFTILCSKVLNNDLVQKVLNTFVELVFVLLTLVLDYLKKYQLKSKRRTTRVNNKTPNTRYNRI